MKKTYFRITVTICVLLLALIFLCGFLFTTIMVDKVQDEYAVKASYATYPLSVHYAPEAFYDPDKVSIVFQNWLMFDNQFDDVGRYNTISYQTNGIYGNVEEVEIQPGTKTEQNYLGFRKTDEISGLPFDLVKRGKIYRVYGDLDQMYPFSRAEDITMMYESVFGMELDLLEEDPPAEKSRKRKKLDAEAEKLFREYEYTIRHSDEPDVYKYTWFTCYNVVISYNYFQGSEIYVESRNVYVFHPLSIVFANFAYIYIIFAVIGAATIVCAVLVMRRLYHNRLSYEARTKNLTRSFAHELKTPLAVTKVYIENWDLIDEKDRPEIASKINCEVDHMAKMVNNLLNLSKMDSGEIALTLEDVELFELTRACCRRMEQIAKERGMTIEIKKDDEDGEYIVPADLDMMKMVISNFLSNAVKYGRKKVEINFLSDANNVTFKITNDGEKISPKEQKKIWDLFYKSDKSGTNRLESNGVGLAVNKSILELHKARFGVSSGEDGTTFWFEIKKVKE